MTVSDSERGSWPDMMIVESPFRLRPPPPAFFPYANSIIELSVSQR
jgi:hypothetical protein